MVIAVDAQVVVETKILLDLFSLLNYYMIILEQ
jgi:hypothetical protein